MMKNQNQLSLENKQQKMKIGYLKKQLKKSKKLCNQLKNFASTGKKEKVEPNENKKDNIPFDRDTLFPTKDNKKPPELADAQFKFFSSLLKNCKRQANGRRYEETDFDICLAFYSISPAAYNFMSKILCLPTEESIRQHFGEKNELLAQALTDIDFVSHIINLWREKNQCEGLVDAILACDACSFDRLSDSNHAYAFVFYVQPIEPGLKCFPVFVLPNIDGKARENVVDLRDQIRDALEKLSINVIAYATDGDGGYNENHANTFFNWIPFFCKHSFEETVKFVRKNRIFFNIADFLHVLKRARAKLFVKPGITMSTMNTDYIFNAETLNGLHILTGGNLFDATDSGFMNDFYAVELFSLQNLNALIENENYNEALYFAPFCFWSAAFLYEGLSKNDRMQLIKLAFSIFYSEFYDLWSLIYWKKTSKQARKITRALHITQKQSKKSKGVLFADESTLMRILNTLLFSYMVLDSYDNVALNRIGTHNLENFFGYVRRLSCGYDSFDQLLHSIIRTIQVRSVVSKYKIPFNVNSRLSAGGVKCYAGSQEDLILQLPNSHFTFFAFVTPPGCELSTKLLTRDETCEEIQSIISKRKATTCPMQKPRACTSSKIISRNIAVTREQRDSREIAKAATQKQNDKMKKMTEILSGDYQFQNEDPEVEFLGNRICQKQEQLDKRIDYLMESGRLVRSANLMRISFLKPEDRRSALRDTMKINSIKQSYIYKSLKNLNEEIDCVEKIMKKLTDSENCGNLIEYLEGKTCDLEEKIDEVENKVDRVSVSLQIEERKNEPIIVEDKLSYKYQLTDEEIDAVHESVTVINKEFSAEPVPCITFADEEDLQASTAQYQLKLEDFHPLFFDDRLLSCFTAIDA